MSTRVKVITFGVISGLIWSVVPGTLNDLFRSNESILVIAAGALTGLVVSLAFKAPLTKFGRN